MNYTKKSLGQNYLIDSNIIRKITSLVTIYNKNILEIGPGKGALTEEILKYKPKSLILVEKDNILSKELKLKYQNNNKIKIYNKDILKLNIEEKIQNNSIVFGNLPYNISSQILVKMIKFKKIPVKYSALIFMFQKEMAERIGGKFNTSKYGRLTILTNYRLKIMSKFNVSPNCFFPKPKIYSTVIHFQTKKKLPGKIKNIENLEKITKLFFSNRRKMINKNIKKIFNKDQLKTMKDLNLQSRPSELNPDKYYEITEFFEKL
jgi:16S rRNA (adenine1518-N6/adenine1519-N6)-dimethyltransferase